MPHTYEYPRGALTVDCVVFGFDEAELKVLLIRRGIAPDALFVAAHPDAETILHLSIQEGRLVFDVHDADDKPLAAVVLAMGPFKMLIKDYQMLLDSYAGAIAEGREAKIQAIDMGRRGLHNEGAELMTERLAGKVIIDFPTARRLFTLVCALHQKL